MSVMYLVTKDDILIGRCVGGDISGWWFEPNTMEHKRSSSASRTMMKCIPKWAFDLSDDLLTADEWQRRTQGFPITRIANNVLEIPFRGCQSLTISQYMPDVDNCITLEIRAGFPRVAEMALFGLPETVTDALIAALGPPAYQIGGSKGTTVESDAK